jgi:hypothetical protein
MALLTRTCRQCQAFFQGGPRAYYCPSCRAERTRKTCAEHKRRKRQGKTRALGSIDACERCGKSYVVNAGLQRFCPVCQPIHAAEHDRRTSLEFYREHKDRINPPRKLKRRKRSNICAICGNVFDPINGSTTCSPECKRKLGNKHNREWRMREKEKNAPPEEVYNMVKIAQKTGKPKSSIQYAYHHGKLPTPDGYSPSGRPFWYRSTIEKILKKQ